MFPLSRLSLNQKRLEGIQRRVSNDISPVSWFTFGIVTSGDLYTLTGVVTMEGRIHNASIDQFGNFTPRYDTGAVTMEILGEDGVMRIYTASLADAGTRLLPTDFSLMYYLNYQTGISSLNSLLFLRPIGTNKIFLPLGINAGLATVAFSANQLYYAPYYHNQNRTVASINMNVTVNTGNIRMGIYNADVNNHLPTTLVVDAGVVTGTGLKTISLSQKLTSGMYFLCWVSSVGVTAYYNNAAYLLNILGNNGTDANTVEAGKYSVFTYAALPTTAPAFAGYTAYESMIGVTLT